MKGADPQLILDDAMSNLEKLRQEKNATYASGMKNLEASDVKIGYNKIDYALNQAKKKAGAIDTKTSRVLKIIIRVFITDMILNSNLNILINL